MKTKKLKPGRFITFFILVTGCFVLIAGRFFQLQVVEGQRYARKFKNQCWNNIPVKAQRGAIFDRHGNPMAYSIESENLFVCTKSDEVISRIAKQVAPILNISSRRLRNKLRANKGHRTYLAKTIDPVVSGKLNLLEIPEVQSEIEFDRVYPYNSTVAALIGFLNHDFEARAGAELYCDEYLKGRDGYRSYMKDGTGALYPVRSQPEMPPIEGNNVYLTIDIEYQQILEEEIKKAVDEWHAIGGMGVLMEVSTGKILAVYHYDPSQTDPHYKYPKARAITDLFEPGSTFKTVVFGALLEERKIDLKDTIYAGEGRFRFNGIPLRDDKKLDIITRAEAFILSSNIATGRLAKLLGPKRLYRYARELGFGLPTGLNFPGEPTGRLHEPEVWSEYYCALLSIGHEVSTSALQMARVFGCIANDGKLMKPILIDRVVSPTGGTIKRFHPQVERTIFSKSAMDTLRQLCEVVVDTGTAKYALLDGITFAGKTGTAEKPSPEGGYDRSRYIASFGGYFPRENPQICGVIIIDEPQKVHYGGITAGPAFAMTAKRITDLEARKKESAERVYLAGANVFKDDLEMEENKESSPQTETIIEHANYSPAEIQDFYEKGDSSAVVLPDLSGKSVRSAVAMLHNMGLKCSLDGAGIVVATIPAAGGVARMGEQVTLVCSGTEREVSY
jgi:cell division protein FtsI (penicillin-binding protein 3)